MSTLKWIWLADRCGVASAEALRLVLRMKDIHAIYDADYEAYIGHGVSEKCADLLCDKSLDFAYSTAEWCAKSGVGILTFSDENYPVFLRTLKDPPMVIYYVGKLPRFNEELFVSVVGTRKMSEYGMKSAYKIAYELSAAGAVVVSGMALGIDGVAASASVHAGGKTVAVLGCGIDIVYPKEHARLKEMICERGAIISEFPPSTEPRGYNFPVRNRIISGLSTATLVVDAPEGSGALITARCAILQGKDLYAVPGNIDGENNLGTNGLLRDGAVAVSCGRDIIKNYAYLYPKTVSMQALAAAETKSQFNPKPLLSMGVSMRVSTPKRTNVPNEKMSDKAEAADEMDFDSFKEQIAQKRSKPKSKEKPKASEPKAEQKTQGTGDNSAKILEQLTPRQREIFSEMPMDKPVTIDYLMGAGYTMGEVMATLTVLEIKGLISSLPGALYIRK